MAFTSAILLNLGLLGGSLCSASPSALFREAAGGGEIGYVHMVRSIRAAAAVVE